MARSPAPIFDRMVFEEYEFREYPKWLYGQGTSKLVNSEAEETALQGEWYTTPGEAAKAAAAKQVADAAAKLGAPAKIGG